jgi:DNA processing protein
VIILKGKPDKNNYLNIDPRHLLITLLLFGRKASFHFWNNIKFAISDYPELWDSLQSEHTPNVSFEEYEKAKFKVEQIEKENIKHSIIQISYFDPAYPKRCLNESDPPLILFCKGNLDLLNHPLQVAVVGTREADALAYETGKNLAFQFANKGFNIISGLAKGSDTAGHLGALEANGYTTAILAHGLQMVYPRENLHLAEKILESDGLLLSEYATGTTRSHFVERNRLQAYLADLLVVIQTDVWGGAMHAVKTALDSNKPLSALYPESDAFRSHPKSTGNEFLVNNKLAMPILNEEDVRYLINRYGM